MKNILILTLMILVSACSSPPKQPELEKPEIIYITKTEYILRIPPKELLTIPDQVKPINIDTAKQGDVAAWILANEERIRELERMIQEIGKFFKVEQEKLKNTGNQTQ